MSGRLRILWAIPEPPRACRSAAQERWWHLLRRIARHHDVTVLTRSDGEDGSWRDDLALADVTVLPPATAVAPDPLHLMPEAVRIAYADPAMRDALGTLLARGGFDLVQYEYQETTASAPAVPPIPSLLTVHQLGFHSEPPGVPRPWPLYRRLRRLDWELRALGKAHRVITMSREDAERLRRFVPDVAVSVSPVGVDLEHFRPPPNPPEPVCDLLFTGNFRHPPNVDAARWLAGEVLPRLPGCRARIVGRGMPAALAEELRRSGVDVAGPVDDMAAALATATVVVAPVRFGTGMRGKVVEGLAMARPVVTTSIGAEGLDATSGRELLVSDDASGFAAAVARVLADPELAIRVGRHGRALVEARFGWDRIATDHERVYEELLSGPRTLPRLPADRSAPLARLAGRLPMPWSGLLGSALLAERGARWYLRTRR